MDCVNLKFTIIRVGAVSRKNPDTTAPLYFLQAFRRPDLWREEQLEEKRVRYEDKLFELVNGLVDQVGDEQFDLMLQAPSSTGYSKPYFDALKERQGSVRDISAAFDKPEGCVSNGLTCEQLKALITFRVPEDLALTDQSVLVVDDVLGTGTTAKVLISHLHEQGLSPDARVVVACALEVIDRIDLIKNETALSKIFEDIRQEEM